MAGFDSEGGQEGAQAVVDRYPAGGTVEVYYDPDRPAAAALEKGRRGAAAWRNMGFVLLAVSLVLLAVIARIRRKALRAGDGPTRGTG